MIAESALSQLLHLPIISPTERSAAAISSFRSLKQQNLESQKSRYILLRPGIGIEPWTSDEISAYQQIEAQEIQQAQDSQKLKQTSLQQPVATIPANFSTPTYPYIQQFQTAKNESKLTVFGAFDTSNFAPEPISLLSRRKISLEKFRNVVNRVVWMNRSVIGAKNLISKLGLREDKMGFGAVFEEVFNGRGSEKFMQKISKDDVICDRGLVCEKQGVEIIGLGEFVQCCGFGSKSAGNDAVIEVVGEINGEMIYRGQNERQFRKIEEEVDWSQFW